jgi:HAE1 family hydrophobic/amphiphilic exporter-1
METVNYYLIPREGVTVRFLGEAQEIQSYFWQYIFIIATAVFLVFGVMASQFESFVDPLIIFFTIPLLFIGVIWIYKLSGQAMSMFSAVGIVALVGVVVNNGIVLVDYTNTLRARGLKVRDACLEAGRCRLRPILMTSLTTILGMAPIAFFPGAGADTIQPIGKTFVGGLTVSTLMTLFVIPVMYSILNSRHDRVTAAEERPRLAAHDAGMLTAK